MARRPVFFKLVLQHHLRLAGDEAHGLAINVTIARGRVGQLLGELDGIAMRFDPPFARVHNLVLLDGIVFLAILAKHADADLDESAAHLGLVKSQGAVVGLELFHGTRDAGTSGGDDLIALVLEVMDSRIDSVIPRPVIVVPLVFERGNNPRPVEASPAIDILGGHRAGKASREARRWRSRPAEHRLPVGAQPPAKPNTTARSSIAVNPIPKRIRHFQPFLGLLRGWEVSPPALGVPRPGHAEQQTPVTYCATSSRA